MSQPSRDSGAPRETHRSPTTSAGSTRGKTSVSTRWGFLRRAEGSRTEISESASLLAELSLLREENARLKAAQHRGAGLDRVVDHARSFLPTTHTVAVDGDDDATQLAVEGLVLRESLLDACAEIKSAMEAIEAKLLAAGPRQQHQPKASPIKKNGATRRPEPARRKPGAA
jgi:hypothetical protein